MLVRERPRDLRIDVAFIIALMGHDLPLDNRVCLRNQGRRILGRGIIERVGNRAKAIQHVTETHVVVM